jgi:hypothetical protein
MKPLVMTVILTPELADYLDHQVLAIRQRTGASLNRSKLLRGILAGVKNSPLDFSRCPTEQQIAGGLSALLETLIAKR